jgi:hypothetical protein
MTGSAVATRTVLRGTAVWLLLAIAAGASGRLQGFEPPFPQVLIAGLTAVLLVLFWTPTSVRSFTGAVDLRALILIHVTRVIAGAYFLVLYGRGDLPWAFAVPGGWGDIAVGVAAPLVCLFPRPESGAGRRASLAWNFFGLLDILMVVGTATRIGLSDPGFVRALLRLPLSVLPTFLVPIIIATHVIIFVRLRRSAR